MVNALLIGVFVGGGVLWPIASLSSYVFGREGLGSGDIKFLAMIGAFLGLGGSSLDVDDCIHSRSDSGYWDHGCESDSSGAVHPFWSFLGSWRMSGIILSG